MPTPVIKLVVYDSTSECSTSALKRFPQTNQIRDSASPQTRKNRRTFRSPFLTVRLHSDVRIKMIQRSICFLASLPPTFVHALNLFIATTWTLVLLRAWNRDERVYLGQRVRILFHQPKYKSDVGNARDVPDLDAVQRLPGCLPHRCLESCRASREDDQGTAGASAAGDIQEVGDPGSEKTCRGARTESTEGRLGLTRPRCLDLQVPPS